MLQHFLCPHALIKNDDKYLVTRRNATVNFAPLQWDIPGGHLIPGEEDISVSLAKKVFQEVGIKVKMGKIVYLFSEIQSPVRHQFQAIYDCEYVGGEIKLGLDGHDEFRWVTVTEMKVLPLMKFLRGLVDNYLSKQA